MKLFSWEPCAILVSLQVGLVGAWWDSGHALTAAVARQYLLSEGAGDVVSLVETFLSVSKDQYPAWSSFISSATFLDKIKSYTSLYSSMHYKDIPFASLADKTALSVLTDAQVEAFVRNNTVIGAPLLIDSAVTTLIAPEGLLADDYAPSVATEFAIRAAIHVLGDIHQPLHSVGWFNEAFCDAAGECTSDEGGNLVKLDKSQLKQELPADIDNLHALWDAMCGQYTKNVEDVDEAYFVAEALKFTKKYPPESFRKLSLLGTYDSFEIMLESYHLAVEKSASRTFSDGTPRRVYVMEYMDFKNPTAPLLKLTDDYINWCADASVQRVTLAGYRIGNFLMQVARSTPSAALQRALQKSNKSAVSNHLALSAAAALSVGCLI